MLAYNLPRQLAIIPITLILVIATRCFFFVHFPDYWCRNSTFPLWPGRRVSPEALRSILETTRLISYTPETRAIAGSPAFSSHR